MEQERPKKRLAYFVRNLSMALVILYLFYFVFNHGTQVSPEEISTPLLSDTPEDTFVSPDLPEEEFQYMEILKTSLPDEELSQRPSMNTTPYRIWCGSYRELFRANNMVEQLNPIIPSHYSQAGEWYVVKTSTMQSKRDAENVRHKIRRKLKTTTCVLQKNTEATEFFILSDTE